MLSPTLPHWLVGLILKPTTCSWPYTQLLSLLALKVKPIPFVGQGLGPLVCWAWPLSSFKSQLHLGLALPELQIHYQVQKGYNGP